MIWTKMRMRYYYVLNSIYRALAEFYLGLEHVNLIFRSNLFWTVAKRFEQCLEKSNKMHMLYIIEWRSLHQLPAA